MARKSLFDFAPSDLKSVPEARRWEAGEQMSAAKLNETVNAVNRMTKGLAPPAQRPSNPLSVGGGTVAVALQTLPGRGNGEATVRRVAYLDDPVNIARREYGYEGEPFQATIDYGTHAFEYDDLLWGALPPDRFNTTFLLARKEGSRWIIALPLSEVERPTQFRVLEHHGDFITAIQWNGNNTIGEQTWIAKPFLLRRTPFDIELNGGKLWGGKLHVYENDGERVVKKDGGLIDGIGPEREEDLIERQFITPSYIPEGGFEVDQLSLVYAVRNIKHGTGVVVTTTVNNEPVTVAVDWLLDDETRNWAWDGKEAEDR